jgi:hypothetical protein
MIESSIFGGTDIEKDHSSELKICRNLQPFFVQLALNSPLKNIQIFKIKKQEKRVDF